ncbi:MAG: glycosyltransferase [Paucibacter sp.]|nr:glycosyltransferase [Roseateles sp.]
MSIAPPCIAVVIPYFQREPGVLARALRSIEAQQGCPLPVHVIVVDDASPHPASEEVTATGCQSVSVRTIVQANGGPGAARNTGLDHTPEGTRYVAFLDSDDEWSPDHLARAVRALDAGFDFYFADHHQLGKAVSAFERSGRIKVAEHQALNFESGEPAADLYAFRGELLRQIIVGNPVGTSTVVYRYERFGQQRFRVEFTNAGEDYLFWMELSQCGARAVFSTQSEARYGRGVNIYAASGWGTDSYLLRVHNEMKYRKLTARLFKLDLPLRQHLRRSIRQLRETFALDVLHRLAHRKPLPWRLLRAHIALDPLAPLGFGQVFLNRILPRRSA